MKKKIDIQCIMRPSKQVGMDIFRQAKTVRLRSHHGKYLQAGENGEAVCQERNGDGKNAEWTVEMVEHPEGIRLRSSCGKYLTASNIPLYPMSGKRVLQTSPERLGSAVEWEPLREGVQIRLRTRYGLFLRANGRFPPWRYSIVHDKGSNHDWVLWDVDVLQPQPPTDS